MKVGDLVKLKNLSKDWGKVAFITKIHITQNGTGQIYVMARQNLATIPWLSRHKYIQGVISESR